jgi:hypothetical protein
MKSSALLNLLALTGLASACAHDHDDKEWTKEELDELEAKWGYEVCLARRDRENCSTYTQPNSGPLLASTPLPT